MSQTLESPVDTFQNRRQFVNSAMPPSVERRQFSNSYEHLSSDARDLANAIDEYKVRHRRRFITYEEMLAVIESLGYIKG